MADNKKKFEQEAKAFFANPKNSNKSTCYITSDGNVFSADHYAQDWKKKLKDRTVEVYHRHNPVSKIIEKIKETLSGSEGSTGSENGSSQTDRDALVKEYIELFDTKPHHKWSDEKVKALIDEKKAESNDPEGSDDVEGTEDTTLPNE